MSTDEYSYSLYTKDSRAGSWQARPNASAANGKTVILHKGRKHVPQTQYTL